MLDALAQLLGVCDFLWDDFLRMQYANLFPVVSDVDALATAKTAPSSRPSWKPSCAVHAAPGSPPSPWRDVLNAFKDREMFRIDMRHILGHTPEFWDFAEELTDLAEVVVNSAFHLTGEDLRSVYGSPRLEDGSPSQMAVLALGKCGGRELGFASDIELMFVYTAATGRPSGARASLPAANSTRKWWKASSRPSAPGARASSKSTCNCARTAKPAAWRFRSESFRRYFAPGGAAWPYERQALVRLRPIAGDANPGPAGDWPCAMSSSIPGGRSMSLPCAPCASDRCATW